MQDCIYDDQRKVNIDRLLPVFDLPDRLPGGLGL